MPSSLQFQHLAVRAGMRHEVDHCHPGGVTRHVLEVLAHLGQNGVREAGGISFKHFRPQVFEGVREVAVVHGGAVLENVQRARHKPEDSAKHGLRPGLPILVDCLLEVMVVVLVWWR